MLQIERVEAAAERFPSEGMLLAGRSIVGSASQAPARFDSMIWTFFDREQI